MYWIFLLLFIVLLKIQLFYLVKSIKNNDNKNWLSFFSMVGSSIISCILIVLYANFYSPNVAESGILVIFFSVVSFLIYCLLLGFGFLIKIIQKLKGVKILRLDKKVKIKRIAIPIIFTLFISICICFVDFIVYKYMDKLECERYDTVKVEKLSDMVDYINKKYDVNYTVNDNVFYREYKYNKYAVNEKKHNDFYVGIFDDGNDVVTISLNKDGFLSDNLQIREIGYLLGDYYSNVVGHDIEFVEIRHNDGMFRDDLINEILQFKFNEIITMDNLELFIDELLKNDVEMIFYMKDRSNRDKVLKDIIDKLKDLEDKVNVKELAIYLYDANSKLNVEEKNILVRGDYKYDEIHLSYYSSHMFGFVYVSNDIEFNEEFNKNNEFVAIAFSNSKYYGADKYKQKDVIDINNWTVYEFE